MPPFSRSTIDETDLAKYDRLGDSWWDLRGPMATLHKFNPVRVDWIADVLQRERPDAGAGQPANALAGCRILDVGCGGGILSESLARRGAAVTGIDPAENNVAVAMRHAEAEHVAVDYRCTTVEAIADAGEQFDAVLVMEVVEHVTDVAAFLHDAARAVRPGGFLFGATLNRTLKSYALAIVGAEYVLRWLPRGTHDWHKFLTPEEFARFLAREKLRLIEQRGVSYDPLRDRWHRSRDLGCNYMLVARKPDDNAR